MPKNLLRASARNARTWLLLCLLCLLSAGVAAAETDAAAAAPTTQPAAPADKPKQCYNGCERWGQMCNVDPRGVYKCQRRCEKFGEICE